MFRAIERIAKRHISNTERKTQSGISGTITDSEEEEVDSGCFRHAERGDFCSHGDSDVSDETSCKDDEGSRAAGMGESAGLGSGSASGRDIGCEDTAGGIDIGSDIIPYFPRDRKREENVQIYELQRTLQGHKDSGRRYEIVPFARLSGQQTM